ncbi:hypothetical protein JQX09_17935 [Sulfitobacter pseudonitzschiae]|uniref:LexA repressor DNA-binding domain-containing protein n=1 Tax=Pseudosulfitobacter pseudonitzschiae TaxID=1402135 RepID=A0A9Q2S1P7_9RHOB|nr:hypothetical protein [Pseudosulfitobacter pseudonitzschiae]MBM2293812.1 hypothetical protein [Pseudosulfitobacter pseudonitzschiae]MBM2298729.1 hypothetical protein [Pseudosulfitobacter pseudonitzschiae]MBM2303644.1 hypothetical protein [Pseudosulfitobacter pseudonitzschiae]MBM2313426.1 hypothetical protein [Pseudosulfitobacter pseudonitzschiae]MBM2318340.1 hypothetical protein [Pseudosulfitobacter pseudonitzschiae]
MTPRHANALKFIRDFIDGHGYSPSYREIADGLGFAGQGQIEAILRSLRDAGYLKYRPRQSRSIELVSPIERDLARVIATYDNGLIDPVEAIEQVRTIAIAAEVFA